MCPCGKGAFPAPATSTLARTRASGEINVQDPLVTDQQSLTVGGRKLVLGFGAGVVVGALAAWLLKP
jgi:hypothetical protein